MVSGGSRSRQVVAGGDRWWQQVVAGGSRWKQVEAGGGSRLRHGEVGMKWFKYLYFAIMNKRGVVAAAAAAAVVVVVVVGGVAARRKMGGDWTGDMALEGSEPHCQTLEGQFTVLSKDYLLR